MKNIRKYLCFILLTAAMLIMTACGKMAEAPAERPDNTSDYYYYEGIFLPEEEVRSAFEEINSEYPKFEIMPSNYHVTTQFMPAEKHEDLYGRKVTVHIYAYAYDAVYDEDEKLLSENEGFGVSLSSADEEIQALLDGIEKNWHITGSYSVAAQYTENVDFSHAEPVSYTIEGIFGGSDSDDNMYFSKP